MKTCSEDGCDRPVLARSLCRMHYQRVYRAEVGPERKREYERQYRERDPERFRALKRARYARDPDSARKYLAIKIKREFGLTLEEYDAYVNGPCEICGKTGPPGERGTRAAIVLDHCGETNTVRGALCQQHNIGLGHFQHDPALLRAAVDYLERHQRGGSV